MITTRELLKAIKQIKFIKLTNKDVVRHELVQKIIKAYEALDETARMTSRSKRT
ncbi:PhoH family protein [Candidatus Omnitrophota bacterium]